jgi:hypothetical protein
LANRDSIRTTQLHDRRAKEKATINGLLVAREQRSSRED